VDRVGLKFIEEESETLISSLYMEKSTEKNYLKRDFPIRNCLKLTKLYYMDVVVF
jgi:hypothetical protein